MQCETVREQFADYVAGRLSPPDDEALAAHFLECAACRSEAEDFRAVWADLGAIPAAAPGPELTRRFQTMLNAYARGLQEAPQKGWWRRLFYVPAIAAAVALLALGIFVGRRIPQAPASAAGPANAELQQLHGEISELRQMVALSLMQQQSASDRLKGVNWTSDLEQPNGEVLNALLGALMHDPNVNVRLAAVDALQQFGDRPVIRRGIVQAMNREQSPMVQVALIDLAVDLREKQSVAALRQFVEDQKADPAVRERAEKGIQRLE